MNARLLLIIGLIACLLPGKGITQDARLKLQSIVLPSVELNEVPLKEALDYFQSRSRELDTEGSIGVNILLNAGDVSDKKVTLKLTGVSLGQALWFTGEVSGTKVVVEPHAVTFVANSGLQQATRQSEPRSAVVAKASGLIQTGVEFAETPFTDAVNLLRSYAFELDPETDLLKKGINIVVMPLPEGREEPTVTLKMNQVPITVMLKYVCDLANYGYSAENGAVVLYPKP